ncbi:unnamed protein product [Amoebophrya sp. A25]|nr:unnamed protein product [Amoebophrya sp. A25]|eukprot:GSA25T00003307001.1
MTSNKLGIIFLHGLGDGDLSFKDTIQHEWNLAPLSVHWRFPMTPQSPVTVYGGEVAPNWFDMDTLPVRAGDKEKPSDIEKSVQRVHNEIKALEEEGVPPERIFVSGFSQGGAMSMQSGLTYPKKIGGIICLSGWLLREDTFSPTQTDVPLLWWHGTQDNVVLTNLQPRGIERLQKLGVSNITVKQSPMGHSSHPDQMSFIPKWIKEIVSRTTGGGNTGGGDL